MLTIKSSQFKLRYQFREYLFSKEQLQTSKPINPGNQSITNIRNSLNTLCLALTFHISLAISARKTAYILKNVFQLPISYQSVLNYAQAASYHCDRFNSHYKDKPDNINAGDETYIKISGKNAYTYFFISIPKRSITSYHVGDSRDEQDAIIAMNEVISNTPEDQKITFITDGNPSYQAAVNYFNFNSKTSDKVTLKKVIGLQNLDSESEEFRYGKQIIERLNRTYKFHTKAANGFKIKNGAVAMTTLFVTHYNFLRPHFFLDYNPPIVLDFIKETDTLQERWATILNKSFELLN